MGASSGKRPIKRQSPPGGNRKKEEKPLRQQDFHLTVRIPVSEYS